MGLRILCQPFSRGATRGPRLGFWLLRPGAWGGAFGSEELGQSAHVGSQRLGDFDRAVFSLVVLQNRYQGPPYGQA